MVRYHSGSVEVEPSYAVLERAKLDLANVGVVAVIQLVL